MREVCKDNKDESAQYVALIKTRPRSTAPAGQKLLETISAIGVNTSRQALGLQELLYSRNNKEVRLPDFLIMDVHPSRFVYDKF